MYERDSEKERPYLYLNSPLPQISECDSSLPSYWARTVQEHTVSSTRLSTYLGECTISKCVFATTHLHLQISITYKMLLKKKNTWYTVHFASSKSLFVCVCTCSACPLGADLQKVLLSTSGAICQWQSRNANQMQSDNTPRLLPPLEQPTEIN